MIYLDAAATTLQKPETVRRAVLNAMERCASPGRGGHPPAMQAAEEVYRCRGLAAAMFGARPEQVVFTMNATHALNLAVHSLVRPGDEVVISGFEHNSVWRPLTAAGARIRIAGRRLFDQGDTLRAFETAVTEHTRAVICTHVSNAFGYILPVRKIAELCRARGVPFVLDASQSAGILQISLKELGAAFIAMPGHKGLYGPQGTGILLCGQMPGVLLAGGTGSVSREAEMPEILPDRAEAGTHNVPGICGLAAGLEFVKRRGTAEIFRHECALRAAFCRMLRENEQIRIFSGPAQSGVLSVQLRGEDCEQTALRLGEAGICVRAGLHCAPLAHESVGTLNTGTVRFSFSAFNSAEECAAVAAILKK